MRERANGPECDTCGAPYSVGLVACPYCRSAYGGATGGVNCPRCGDVNRSENPECASCHTPLVRPCVFCGGAATLSAVQCPRCGEAFAGSAERKRVRDAQAQQQQTVQLVERGIGVVGQIASSPGASSSILDVFETLVEQARKVSS